MLVYDENEIGSLSIYNSSDLVLKTYKDSFYIYKNRYGLAVMDKKIKTDDYFRNNKLKKLIYNEK